MRTLRRTCLLVGLACLAAAPEATAQVDVIAGTVQIDGGAVQALSGSPWNAGEAININLTSFLPGDGALNGHWVLLHVFDTATGDPGAPPANSIGRLTLAGSIGVEDPFNPGQVQLLISSALETDFPTFAEFPISPGATDWAGLECSAPDLQRRSLIAASLLGDLTDDLAVGRIHRIESFAVVEGGVYQRGGRIMGDIVSNAPNDTLYPFGTAIRSVVAHREISGDLLATLPANMGGDPPTRASIGAIRLQGPFASSLSGDISAVHGAIGTIWSAAPIGRALGPTLKIWAGHGIRQVVAFDEASNQEVDADIDANIYAYQVGPNGEKSYEANLQRGPAFDAPIELIATKGSITGEIRAGNIHRGGGIGAVPIVTRMGIYCDPECIDGTKGGGDLLAPVTIDYVCEGTIAARTIQAPIVIGRMLEGAIVAWDVDAEQVPTELNKIPLISIGEAGNLSDPAYSSYEPGFTGFGIGAVCWTPNFRECEELGLVFQGDCEEGTAASIIAARRIDELSISRVTVWEQSEGYSHAYPPLIEALSIGTLSIGQLREGIVWSGIVVPEVPGEPEHLGNRYASIENIVLGCVGPMADIWAADFTRIDVAKNFLGELHTPTLPDGATIQIGGSLSGPGPDARDNCNCAELGANICVGASENWEPLHPIGDLRADLMAPRAPFSDRAPVGAIRITEPYSLGGQIVIHAATTAAVPDSAAWGGDVIIGDGTIAGDRIVLSADPARASFPGGQAADAVGPLYRIPSHLLGGISPTQRGGAVGLVPFARYEADCTPENYRYFEDTNHSNAPFLNEDNFVAGIDAAHVAYYGPVFSAGKGLELNRVNRLNSAVLGPVGDTLYTTDAMNGNRAERRVVAVKGTGQTLLGGRFALLPRGSVSAIDDLLCDLGPNITPPLTYEPADSPSRYARYDFLLAEPCSLAECARCFVDMGYPLNQFCFIADYNEDGGVDGDDIIAFFADWEANIFGADVNLDGGVDGDDVIVFFCWWDAGGCNAN